MEVSLEKLNAAVVAFTGHASAVPTSDETEAPNLFPGRLGRLSAQEVKLLRAILNKPPSGDLDIAVRRLIVRALEPAIPINEDSLAQLCAKLTVQSNPEGIGSIASAFARRRTVGAAIAVKTLRAAFIMSSSLTVEAVLDELAAARLRLQDPDLMTVCRRLPNLSHNVDEAITSAMRTAMLGKRNSLVVAHEAAKTLGLSLTYPEIIAVRVDVARQRDQKIRTDDLTDVVLERITHALLGAKPNIANVDVACRRAGVRLAVADRKRAASILKERLHPFTVSLAYRTRNLLDLLRSRLPGTDNALLIDRALLTLMRELSSNGEAALDEALGVFEHRKLVVGHFRMLQVGPERNDVHARRKKPRPQQADGAGGSN